MNIINITHFRLNSILTAEALFRFRFNTLWCIHLRLNILEDHNKNQISSDSEIEKQPTSKLTEKISNSFWIKETHNGINRNYIFGQLKHHQSTLNIQGV